MGRDSVDVTLREWGNSFGISVPKGMAARLGLKPSDRITLSIIGDTIVLRPKRQTISLAAIVADLAKGDNHDEVDTGPSVGAEEW